MVEIKITGELAEKLQKIRILYMQMDLIMDIIEDWYGIQIDRKAVEKELVNRIAREKRKECIRPVK